ncbi:MAG: leucine--tRNA ligase [Bacteroidia bacterium]|nr:MAG: leucine--tRNA ligase [Bacteroidia bacterium]
MDFNFKEIEKTAREKWEKLNVYQTPNDFSKKKFYVLDMFPYPSGSGLHVGHPLGYIASDIYARYKKHCGYNVLHPMGFDAFGLPAEQYAIQTGQHPAITTQQNIQRYKEQLNKIGLSYDWNREVITCDPKYYKWTQWIFLKLFNSWYDNKSNKARPIKDLVHVFEKEGNANVCAACDDVKIFSAEEWKAFSEKEKSDVLMKYRLAYHSEAYVNWCPALGTVLANDEVKDGVSERGGFLVERKLMPQWSLRITAYAERLLEGLEKLDWSESIKEAQRNWIGKSEGAEINFDLENYSEKITIFTTRPDTIFGVSYVVLAPEHPLIQKITTPEQKQLVEEYVQYAKNRSERERQSEINKVTGVFTGAYAIHPFTSKKIPVWIADYVLYHYGTGAVMAVPAHDSRDFRFAKHFHLPIIQVIQPPVEWDFSQNSYDEKNGKCIHSDFLNNLEVKDAIQKAIEEVEKRKLGKRVVNYKLRDAVFGRQRYWGEPIPIYYDELGIPRPVDESDLPIQLPNIDKYLPTETGEPPLARASNWKYKDKYEFEKTTMPGWAGSSWYFLRYMDPHNDKTFANKELLDYWNKVDVYVGGSEHATGHLLYARFWTKFLYDLGYLNFEEPFQKLINQGMILGNSAYIYRLDTHTYVSADAIDDEKLKGKLLTKVHVDVNDVDENNFVTIDKILAKSAFYGNDLNFITPHKDKLLCYREVEKMSKSKWNVLNPDDLIDQYGADTFRLYEMFLGPIEQHKPFITNGITGTYNFLRKLLRLYFKDEQFYLSNEKPSLEEYKILHKTILKVREDIERFSFNTCVSSLMILVNKLTELKTDKREILEPLIILISPFAPFTAEYLWTQAGHEDSVVLAPYPEPILEYTVDNTFNYPISFNGKTRFNLEIPLNIPKEQVEQIVLTHELTQKYLNNNKPKKFIFVEKKIVNIVV